MVLVSKSMLILGMWTFGWYVALIMFVTCRRFDEGGRCQWIGMTTFMTVFLGFLLGVYVPLRFLRL